jgi:hypothetical protein
LRVVAPAFACRVAAAVRVSCRLRLRACRRRSSVVSLAFACRVESPAFACRVAAVRLSSASSKFVVGVVSFNCLVSVVAVSSLRSRWRWNSKCQPGAWIAREICYERSRAIRISSTSPVRVALNTRTHLYTHPHLVLRQQNANCRTFAPRELNCVRYGFVVGKSRAHHFRQ